MNGLSALWSRLSFAGPTGIGAKMQLEMVPKLRIHAAMVSNPCGGLHISKKLISANSGIVQDRPQSAPIQLRMKRNGDEGNIISEGDMASPLSEHPKTETLHQNLD
jgi:hypothetical protein